MKRNLNQKIQDLRDGKIPQVTARELWDDTPGEVPGVEVRAILKLADAIFAAESCDCAVSWAAQERALAYYNEHGLGATLDEAFRLEELALKPTDETAE